MKKLIAVLIPVLIPVLILAFPTAVENLFNKAGELFMMIITPALEFIANLIR